MKSPGNILISRTDSIGDVILTLPVAKKLRQRFPESRIGFLGKEYTRAVIEACSYIDQFIEVNDFLSDTHQDLIDGYDTILHVFPVAELARRARELDIPLRVGTTNRLFHWGNCNKMIRLSRINSGLHEAQLNLKLLAGLGIDERPSLDELSDDIYLDRIKPLCKEFRHLIDPERFNLILHPKSQGSAREWGLPNFLQLIEQLDQNKFKIFISGTATERELLLGFLDKAGSRVTDLTGLMKLEDFISFINASDGIIANSTGPLHIGAALGKHALGIYPPIRPMHPGRWAPIGRKASYFVVEKDCVDCRKNPVSCYCISQVSPSTIAEALGARLGQKETTI